MFAFCVRSNIAQQSVPCAWAYAACVHRILSAKL